MLVIVTIASLSLASGLGIALWRTMRDARRRSDARVAALEAEILRDDLLLRQPVSQTASAAAAHMFEATDALPGLRPAASLVIAFLVLATTATLVVVLGHPSRSLGPSANRSPARALLPAREPLPLELVALDHEREGDRLIIRGVIRNPTTGASIDHLTAVVLLLNADGDVITRGRASVEADALLPGRETRFIVAVPNSGDVGRFRISFRTDDRVVPHVDRRT